MFNRRSLPPLFFYLLLIFIGFLILNFLGILRPLRGLAERSLIIPLQEKVYRTQRFFKKDLGGCVLQNQREVAELKVQLAALAEENKEQKRLLSSPLPKNWQFMPVKVIGLGEETLTINQGLKGGVKEGMVALWGQTFLGRVVSVSEEIAQIRLPSFFEERLAARTSGSLGLLIGRGQGKMRLEQVLVNETITKGDLVTANLEGGDLLVGEVEEVITAKGEAFKTAQVKILFNPEELETVFLIKGKI